MENPKEENTDTPPNEIQSNLAAQEAALVEAKKQRKNQEKYFNKIYVRQDEIEKLLEDKIAPMKLLVSTLDNTMNRYQDDLNKIWNKFITDAEFMN